MVQRHAVRPIGHVKLHLGVSDCVYGCICLSALQPVQGVSCLLPNDSWDRLQHPHPMTQNMCNMVSCIALVFVCFPFLFSFPDVSGHVLWFWISYSSFTLPFFAMPLICVLSVFFLASIEQFFI